MHIVRQEDARPYDAANHHGVHAFRLHGRDATPSPNFWIGLSIFEPGGGADRGASPTEKVYIVLEGEIVVGTGQGDVTLSAGDSCLIAPGEERIVENRSLSPARMLVVSPS